MTEQEETKTITYSQVPALMTMIEKRLKELPSDEPKLMPAMSIIQILLSVVAAYAEWCDGMKKEMITLVELNKSQAALIKENAILKKRVGSGPVIL